MPVIQRNPSKLNRFRNFNYRISSGTFAAGDLISLNIYQQNLRGIRQMSLAIAKSTSDYKAILGGGQGVKLRIQRRIAGRAAGVLGRALIPQGLGFATRLMNKYYGRYMSKEIQTYYNKKAKIHAHYDGAKMTLVAQRALSNAKLNRQYENSLRQLADKVPGKDGMDIRMFSIPGILRHTHAGMIGSLGDEYGAPVVSGNLIDSINNRGMTFNSEEGIAEGLLTVGSSEGNTSLAIADQAPYWWKTVWGGYYDLRQFGINKPKQWIRPKNQYWFAKAVKYGLEKNIGKHGMIMMNNATSSYSLKERPVSSYNLTDFQPAFPGSNSFELSVHNTIERTSTSNSNQPKWDLPF